jgi:hypothetical protein
MLRDDLRSSLYNVTQQAMATESEREVINDLLTLAVIYAVPAGIPETDLLAHLRRAYNECVRVLPTQKAVTEA